MPRRLKLSTAEMGMLELQLLYSYQGVWEEDWALLQGSFLAESFTVTTKEVVDHALRGWTKPLVTALGIPPEGALRKLPPTAKVCSSLRGCPHSGPDCHPLAKKMPWCFVPAGVVAPAEPKASEVVQLWREGVHIVVLEDPNGRPL
jgi:hypothetical protein